MTNRTILSSVSRPGRYLGHEYNASVKDWQSAQTRFALIFPDLYEIGMSHQGLQILYHILNSRTEFIAERCYCPDIDMEKVIRAGQEQLMSLESSRPLCEFDILGFTLPYELCYTNILTVLDLAGIPFYSQQRDSSYPIILGGGACALNPEPVADFFDAILLGDGEEAIIEIGSILSSLKNKDLDKAEILDSLASVKGVYIPSHFAPQYDPLGNLLSIDKIGGQQPQVTRRVLADLNDIEHLQKPLVPNAKIVHDRLGIEVARGCTRGCRFCQAGITYRPVRERHPDKIMQLAQNGIHDSGFDELALLSLSTGDYSCLEQVLPQLMDEFVHDYVSVAMPSMRVGTLTPAIMDQVKRVRKTGFTLAPEAGSERLRRVINKGITEEDLLKTCEEAFALGWRVIKFYFMIGLPTETEEDIEAIGTLIKKAIAICKQGQAKGKKQINVSVGTFVPKPHTPFQWSKQLTIDESRAHIAFLQKQLPRKGCNLKYHNPKTSYLEGVFSRGDRRLAQLLESAWQAGARLDGWDEYFDLFRWQECAEKCNIDLDSYLRQREFTETLPWGHLQTGIDLEFLKDEFQKAKDEGYTPDCRYHSCQNCGLCDFKTLFPKVYSKDDLREQRDTEQTDKEPKTSPVKTYSQEDNHFKYIVHYSRSGDVCYLGHLEILQTVFRVLRRANIPTNYSQGFNPSPKISFGPALPVGTESLAEYFIMDLKIPLKDLQATMQLLNKTMIPGLEVTQIAPHSGKIPQKLELSYLLYLNRTIDDSEKNMISEFLNSDDFFVKKTRKGKTKQINIRPLVLDISVPSPDIIGLRLLSASAQPGIKPIEAITEILKLPPETALQVRIKKTSWQPLD